MQWFSNKPERRKTYPKATATMGVAEGPAASSDKFPFSFTNGLTNLKGNQNPKHSHTLPTPSSVAQNDVHNPVVQHSNGVNTRKRMLMDKGKQSNFHKPGNLTSTRLGSTLKGQDFVKTVIGKMEARGLHYGTKIGFVPPATNQGLVSDTLRSLSTSAPPFGNGGRSTVAAENGIQSYPEADEPNGVYISVHDGEFEAHSFKPQRPSAYQTSAMPSLLISSLLSHRLPSIPPLGYAHSTNFPRKESTQLFDFKQDDTTIAMESSSQKTSSHTSGFDEINTTHSQDETLEELGEMADFSSVTPQHLSLMPKGEIPTESIGPRDQPLSLEVLMTQNGPVDLSGEINLKPGPPVVAGGFASVHFGDWDGNLVAVKVLMARKNQQNPAQWETSMERRLRREISVWAALSHPNIVEFYGYATGLSDFPVMVSKWCRNGNAAQYLERNQSVTHQDRFHLAQDVASGLEYLHSLKVIHGDLKPQNVLISDERRGQLCDFGLVSLAEWHGPAGMTTTSPYGGTERYKAHELFPSAANPDPKPSLGSDVYALGCVAYEFIDLKQPFHELRGIYAILDAVKDGEPPASRPANLQPQAAIDLWDLLEACWRLEPLERPNASNVVSGLRGIYDMRYG